MGAATLLPGLSQVRTLDTTYLQEAEQFWTRTGNLWDQVFTEIHEKASTPGGTPWTGQAAAASQERAYVDLIKVRGAAFQLQEAAGIARRGNEQLQARKDEVLEAVSDAREDGFQVGEDYSVTDRSQGRSAEFRAERVAQAQGHAAFIRHLVAALVTTDQQLTEQITAATEGIDELTFREPPAGVDDAIGRDDKHSEVHTVDHHWNQDPKPTPINGPSADDIRRVLEKLPQGTNPRIREVRSSEELERLWEWLGQGGVERPRAYEPDSSKGVWKDLPGGGGVGRRNTAKSTEDSAIDINIPGDKGNWKVHINPRGGVPDIPEPARPVPLKAVAPDRAPVASPPEPAPGPPEPAEAPPVRGVPELPFGGGLTAHSPATGPHPVYGPHHHSVEPPVLGDEPDEVP
jgi:hypothetical protein